MVFVEAMLGMADLKSYSHVSVWSVLYSAVLFVADVQIEDILTMKNVNLWIAWLQLVLQTFYAPFLL